MNRADAIQLAAPIVPECAAIHAGERTPEGVWAEPLGIDSVSALELLLVVEAEVGRTVPLEVVGEWHTVGDLVRWMEDIC